MASFDHDDDLVACEAMRNATLARGFIPPNERPTGAAFQRVQFIVEIILLILSLACFVFFKFVHPQRQYFYRIKARQFRSVALVHIGTMFGVVTGSYFWSTPLEQGVPCYFQIFAEVNTVSFIAIPFFIRLYYFHRSDQLTQMLVVERKNSAVGTTTGHRRVDGGTRKTVYAGKSRKTVHGNNDVDNATDNDDTATDMSNNDDSATINQSDISTNKSRRTTWAAAAAAHSSSNNHSNILQFFNKNSVTEAAAAAAEAANETPLNKDDVADDEDGSSTAHSSEHRARISWLRCLCSCCYGRRARRLCGGWWCCCCCNGGGAMFTTEERVEDKLLRLKTSISKPVLLLILCFALAPYIVSSLVFIGIQDHVACRGCQTSEDALYVVLVQGVFALVLLSVYLYLVRGLQDSFGVLSELRSSVYWGALPAYITFGLATVVGSVGEFHFIILVEIFFVVLCYVQSVLQCVLAWREYKHTIAAMDTYHLSLPEYETLVVHPDGPYHAAFCKHLEVEHSLESISFLNAIHLFEKNFFDTNVKTNTSRARRIISMYVGDDAVLSCNLSSRVSEHLLLFQLYSSSTATTTATTTTTTVVALPDQPQSVTGPVAVTLFAAAKEEISLMLYRDAFNRFLVTDQFQQIYQRVHLAAAATAAAPGGEV